MKVFSLPQTAAAAAGNLIVLDMTMKQFSVTAVGR